MQRYLFLYWAFCFSELLFGAKLKNMGRNPQIRKNFGIMPISWFAPVIRTSVGAGLYFLIFPEHFDLSRNYITVIAEKESLKQMEA